MQKLKGAVVGVGYLGQFHAQKYKACPEVELIGVYDQNQEQCKKIADSLSVRAFSSLSDLKGQVEVATIATSTQSHYPVAKELLGYGIHLNIEKPLTATIAQSEEILALAAQKGLKIATGHIERFNPAIQEARKWVNQPKQIHLIRRAPFKARGADVSVLHDLMIHDVDLMYWLTGSEVVSFEASGAKIVSQELDIANVWAQMNNGMKVFISVSRVAPVTERSIRFEEAGQSLFVNTGSLELERVTRMGQALELKVEKWSAQKKDALQLETNAFIGALTSKSEPVVSGLDGLRALRFVEQVSARIKKQNGE